MNGRTRVLYYNAGRSLAQQYPCSTQVNGRPLELVQPEALKLQAAGAHSAMTGYYHNENCLSVMSFKLYSQPDQNLNVTNEYLKSYMKVC